MRVWVSDFLVEVAFKRMERLQTLLQYLFLDLLRITKLVVVQIKRFRPKIMISSKQGEQKTVRMRLPLVVVHIVPRLDVRLRKIIFVFRLFHVEHVMVNLVERLFVI